MSLTVNDRALKAMTDVYGSVGLAAMASRADLENLASHTGVALADLEQTQAALIAAACERAHLAGKKSAKDREVAQVSAPAHGGGRIHQLSLLVKGDRPNGLSTAEKIESNRLVARFLEENPSPGQTACARLFVEQHFQPKGPVSPVLQEMVDAVEWMIRSVGFYWCGVNSTVGDGPHQYGRLLHRLSDGRGSREDLHAVLNAVNLGSDAAKRVARADAAGLEGMSEKYGAARVNLVRAMTALLDSQGMLETLFETAKDKLQS